MVFTRACSFSDCKPGTLREVLVSGQPIVIANVRGTLYALDGWCSNKRAPLAEGVIEGDTIICPYHHEQFDCKTGNVIHNMPPEYGQATALKTYAVRLEGNDVFVNV